MLAGPSGVGKTETALALAEALYGGEQNLITINMSEFQEAHTVSTLKGAPPGYVGYGEGGVLTEAVRRRPYSVVLLDEVEKAHSDVHEIFFQVFDKGLMEDGEGPLHRLQEHPHPAHLQRRQRPHHEHVQGSRAAARIRRRSPRRCAPPLLKVFPAALLGRMVTIPYYPLSDEMIGSIVRLQLARIVRRVGEHTASRLTYDDAVVKLIAQPLHRIGERRAHDRRDPHQHAPAAHQPGVLGRMGDANPVKRVKISAPGQDFEYAFE